MPTSVRRIESPSIPPVQERKTSPFQEREERSTLGPSTSPPPFAPSKPELAPPTVGTIHQVLRSEAAANTYSLQKELRIERELKGIERFHLEEERKIDEAEAAKERVGFWSTLEDITNMVSGGVSFFYGFSLLSTGGTIAGGLLITSGVLSLTNIAFKYGQLWDSAAEILSFGNEELRQGISTYVPCAIGIGAAAAGMFGMYQGWSLVGATSMQTALSVIQTITGVASGVSALARGRAESHYTWTSADLSFLQSKMQFATLSVDEMVEDLTDFHRSQAEKVKIAARLIEEAERAIQVTQHPV